MLVKFSLVSIATFVAVGLSVAPAAADPVITEVLEILKDRGLIDEDKHTELVSKNQLYEQQHESLLGRIEWSGDFRARTESFWFEEDDTGASRSNRHRIRYRLRLGAKAKVNDWATVFFRLASGEGEGDPRNSNRTLGADDDFDPDPIFIDQAYVELKAPRSWGGDATDVRLLFGKTYNPFIWEQARDHMLWDLDIMPEGGALLIRTGPNADLAAYFTAGYYMIDENDRSTDPHVIAVQGGLDYALSERWDLGGRASWYGFSSLNDSFDDRARASGSVNEGGYQVLELAGYLRFNGIEGWPAVLFGHYARNFDSSVASPTTSGDEDTGWGVGFEIGDKRELVKLGLGYYELEANFFPAQLVDSTLCDGRTNRACYVFWIQRELLRNTDLKITVARSDALRSELPLFSQSVVDSERVRLQADLILKF